MGQATLDGTHLLIAAGRKPNVQDLNLEAAGIKYDKRGIQISKALLTSNPRPTDADIDAALSGNLCRCATYVRIRAAIHDAAKTLGV